MNPCAPPFSRRRAAGPLLSLVFRSAFALGLVLFGPAPNVFGADTLFATNDIMRGYAFQAISGGGQSGSVAGMGTSGDFWAGQYSPGGQLQEVYRNFFVFSIPPEVGLVVAAELDVPDYLGETDLQTGYQILEPSVTYQVHAVTVPITDLVTGTSPTLCQSLGDGAAYGEGVFTAESKLVKIPLSSAFLQDVNSAIGSSIAIAGGLSLKSSTNGTIFINTSGLVVSLYLTVRPAPGVTTQYPMQIGSSSAQVSADVTTNGLDCTVTFLANGVKVGAVDVPGTVAEKTVSLVLHGLSPATMYAVTTTVSPTIRPVVVGQGGETDFTTLAAPTTAVATLGGNEAATGAAVPGAGTFAGIPAGATYGTFGLPCLDSTGAVAFTATLSGKKAPSAILGPTAPGTAGPLAVTGGAFPGGTGIVYAGFSDPALGGPASGATGAQAFGKTAFLATLSGPGIKATNGAALLSTATADGTLGVLTRTGDSLLGATVAAIRSFAVDGSGNPCAVVRFALGNGVTAANAMAFVQWVDGAPSLLVRQGDLITVTGSEPQKKISSVAALLSAPGSAGAARGPVVNGNGLPACRVTFTKDGSQAILRGENDVEAYTGGQPLYANADEEYQSFGYPAGGPIATFSAAFKVQGKVKGGHNKFVLITLHDGTAYPLRQGADAFSNSDQTMTNYTFASFSQPVGGEDNGIAFAAMLTGAGVSASNAQGVYWIDGDGGQWRVGRVGEPAPGIYSANLATITSVALMPGYELWGPVFVGTISGSGVTSANNTALFGAYPSADQSTVFTDKLLRTGDSVEVGGTPQIVTALSALHGSAGSLAQARGYNGLGQIASRVALKGGTSGGQAIVITTLP